MSQHKYILDEASIPTHWYNIEADLPERTPPPLDHTTGKPMEAAKLVFENLPRCYHDGPMDEEAREHMHNASAMAGMAFANAVTPFHNPNTFGWSQ